MNTNFLSLTIRVVKISAIILLAVCGTVHAQTSSSCPESITVESWVPSGNVTQITYKVGADQFTLTDDDGVATVAIAYQYLKDSRPRGSRRTIEEELDRRSPAEALALDVPSWKGPLGNALKEGLRRTREYANSPEIRRSNREWSDSVLAGLEDLQGIESKSTITVADLKRVGDFVAEEIDRHWYTTAQSGRSIGSPNFNEPPLNALHGGGESFKYPAGCRTAFQGDFGNVFQPTSTPAGPPATTSQGASGGGGR